MTERNLTDREKNYQMIDQVQLIYQAVEAYRNGFANTREAVEEMELEDARKQQLIKSLERPYIECVLIFEKDEEIHAETMKYIYGLGLDLKECSKEERHFRAIPNTIDAYKLVGRLEY